MSNSYLVTLNVSPPLEERITDCLLALESEQGFSSFPVSTHHYENRELSLAEQVMGRQKKIRFQIAVDDQDLPHLLAQLRQEFSGSGIQYEVLPVIEKGVI
jgi:hypothetical protein